MAFFFGPSISAAEQSKEDAKRYFIDLALRNRQFESQQNALANELALKEAALVRQEQARNNAIARQNQQLALTIGRLKQAGDLRRDELALRDTIAKGNLGARQAALGQDQYFKTAGLGLKEKELGLRERLANNRSQLSEKRGFFNRLIKSKGITGLDQFQKAIAGHNLNDLEIDEGLRVLYQNQKHAQNYRDFMGSIVNGLNQRYKAGENFRELTEDAKRDARIAIDYSDKKEPFKLAPVPILQMDTDAIQYFENPDSPQAQPSQPTQINPNDPLRLDL